MQLKREHLFGAGVTLIVAGALLLGGLSHDTDPATVESSAERALASVDPRSAREALVSRCVLDGGASADALLQRTCTAVAEIQNLDNQPLAAATRLNELARARVATPDQGALLAEIQVLRIELLLTAGHSREAASEAQRWAEARRAEKSVGSARLWLAAARAQRAIGDEEAAVFDARQAEAAAKHAR